MTEEPQCHLLSVSFQTCTGWGQDNCRLWLLTANAAHTLLTRFKLWLMPQRSGPDPKAFESTRRGKAPLPNRKVWHQGCVTHHQLQFHSSNCSLQLNSNCVFNSLEGNTNCAQFLTKQLLQLLKSAKETAAGIAGATQGPSQGSWILWRNQGCFKKPGEKKSQVKDKPQVQRQVHHEASFIQVWFVVLAAVTWQEHSPCLTQASL